MARTFGKTISEARKRLCISQKELASRVKKDDGSEISAQYLNDIEHDRRNPPAEIMIVQFADELQLDRDYLCMIAGSIPKDILEKVLRSSDEHVSREIKAFRKKL